MNGLRRSGFADRFFDRQRREILHRIEYEQQLRLRRRAGLALIAAALVMTVLAFAVVGSPPPDDRSTLARLGTSDIPAQLESFEVPTAAVDGNDPLGAFGAWEAAPLLAEDLDEGTDPALPTLEGGTADADADDPLRWLDPFDPSALNASPPSERG
ncbi:MAG TPA: hypothetical protein ENK10_04525 [Acidobacteria bacterium]|nr:hypothetical protein [Acidobacteriota bacterium]